VRRFGSSPETRAIAAATLQAAATGALLLASMFLIFGLGGPVHLGFGSYASLALLVLVAGFIFGGLGTGLMLMLAGVPVARMIGHRLDSRIGTALAMGAALVGIAAFYTVAGMDEFIAMAAACFALPAALLYRRQVLLEAALERP
jgi:hypothetical protein